MSGKWYMYMLSFNIIFLDQLHVLIVLDRNGLALRDFVDANKGPRPHEYNYMWPTSWKVRILHLNHITVESFKDALKGQEDRGFSPHICAFSVGINELILGLSPIDTCKRVVDVVNHSDESRCLRRCVIYMPILLWELKCWGLPPEKSTEDNILRLELNILLYNRMLVRVFQYTINPVSIHMYGPPGIFRGKTKGGHPKSILSDKWGAAYLLMNLLRDIGGAVGALKQGSQLYRDYQRYRDKVVVNDEEFLVFNTNPKSLESADRQVLLYVGQYHREFNPEIVFGSPEDIPCPRPPERKTV